jgi:predicted nuclease of predicted toxin-antitoxin system
MTTFLANENTPREAVMRARSAGYDIAWIAEQFPGVDDDAVLEIARREQRVLITFDKDFGELVFRRGKDGSNGVLLLRPRISSPSSVADFLVVVLSASFEWEGHFTVAREGVLRSISLT